MIKAKLKALNSRINNTEEQIRDLEDRIMELSPTRIADRKAKGKKKKKKGSNIRDLWDNIKHANLHIIGIPEGEEKRGLKMDLKKLWEFLLWLNGNESN